MLELVVTRILDFLSSEWPGTGDLQRWLYEQPGKSKRIATYRVGGGNGVIDVDGETRVYSKIQSTPSNQKIYTKDIPELE